MGDDPVRLALIAARWLHFASLFALFGGAAFFLAAPPEVASARSRRAAAAALRLAAPLAVVTGLAWLAASLVGMAGGVAEAFAPDFLRVFVFETPFGPVAVVRLALFAGLLGAVALPAHLLFAATTALAGALLVSQAWLGHAAEGGPAGGAMIASYAAHVLAGALWLGGLPALLLVLAEGGAAALSRFSTVAAVAALAVVASGAANTLFHSGGDAGALVASAYGRVLAVKLALVAGMLLLAAATRFVAMPRLRRGEPARPARLVAAELCAGLAVLLAAAVLGITAPPG